MIEPVILGGGKTIFLDDGALPTLELVTSGTGVHLSAWPGCSSTSVWRVQ